MRDLSNSAWKTSWRSLTDALGAIPKFPAGCLALFVLMTGQQYFLGDAAYVQTVEQLLRPEVGLRMIGVGLVYAILALLFWPSFLRYFAIGDENHPYGIQPPFFRMVGWSAGISIIFWLVAAIVIWGSYSLYMQGSITPAWIVFIIFWALLSWIGLRLLTIWPALSLDEPGPILNRAFAETKGHVWFMIRVFLSLMVLIIVAAFVAIFAWGYFVGLPDPTQNPVPVERGIAEMAVTGLINTLAVVWGFAFLGRIFRRVRGIA